MLLGTISASVELPVTIDTLTPAGTKSIQPWRNLLSVSLYATQHSSPFNLPVPILHLWFGKVVIYDDHAKYLQPYLQNFPSFPSELNPACQPL